VWQHNYEPIAGSLGMSSIAAALPIVVLFVMLGVLRKPAWMSAATALASGLLVSLIVYRMPVDLALISTIYGAAFGIFPIAWIVFASIMLYRLAVDTGKFEVIKDSIGGLTTDRRLQAMFIAFSFGAFIEGAAGFGAPVAISGAMLAGLGFNPFYAAGICLLANTAPVAFGSIGIPVTTLANVTGLPVLALSAMVGTLCAMISVFIPGYLIVVMAGWKRAVEVLPAILACGLSFAGMQYYVSNNLGPELTDIASSLTCIVVMVVVLKVWTPKTIMRLEGDKPATLTASKHSMGELFAGWLPYLLLVVFVLTWGEPDIKAAIDRWTHSILPSFLPVSGTGLNNLEVPGLHNLITRMPPVTAKPSPYAAPYAFNWLSVPVGSYSLSAVARDNLGASTVSSWRDITVGTTTLSKAIFTPAVVPDSVDYYTFEVFAADSDPNVSAPLANQNLGTPAVVNGECTVDIRTMIAGLASGSYVATVSAVTAGEGTLRSAPFAFTR